MITSTPIAFLITISLAAPDGGVVDAPYADPDAGVFEVSSAVAASDGGILDPGWYLTRARMKRIGERLTECENERAAQPGPGYWALAAGVSGFVTGIALTIYAVGAIKK